MQILTQIEEKHEVVLVFIRLNNGADIFDFVKPRLLIRVLLRLLKCVDVVCRLHVNPVEFVSGTESLEFLGLFGEHDVLIWLLELPDYFRRDEIYLLS